jgi:hypothetical protein
MEKFPTLENQRRNFLELGEIRQKSVNFSDFPSDANLTAYQ